MGYYEGLPIYKAATDLVVKLDEAVRRFSRFHKYAIGSRLRETALEVVLLKARSNNRAARPQALDALCARVEELKILLNLGKEVRAFQSFEEFVKLIEQAVGIARQAEGWRKGLHKSRPEPRTVEPREGRP